MGIFFYTGHYMSKSAYNKFEYLLRVSGDGRPNLFSGSIIHMTKSVGIVPSCVVNSSKGEVKLIFVEEIFHSGTDYKN